MSLDELRRFLEREGWASRFVVPESVTVDDYNFGMDPGKLQSLDKLLALEPTLPTAHRELWVLIFHDGQDVIDVAVGMRPRPERRRDERA